MSGLDYETVARLAQQGGTLFFVILFAASLAYALWPGRRAQFQQLARQPLEDDETDHV